MTRTQIDMLRRLVASQGLEQTARDANMGTVTLLRLLSETGSVRPGTEALALAYLSKVRA